MSKYKKRADGRYCTTVTLGGYDENGNPKKKMLYGKTQKELDEKVMALRSQLSEGYNIFDGNITFGKYASKWLSAHKKNQSIQTKNMYQNIIDNHLELLNDIPMSKITGTLIQEQINAKVDRPRIAELTLLTCKQIFQSAINDRILSFSPCTNISLPRKRTKPKRAFTDAEKRSIINADYTLQEKALIYLMYYTGMRPAEVYALTWNDIDFEKEIVDVNKSLNFDGQKPFVAPPKTNEGTRHIEMHRTLVEALKEYKASNSATILFGTLNDEYMTLSNYQTLFRHCKQKITDKLGHDSDFTAYYFRHNFCTSCYYSNISIKETIRLMGHADNQMILRVYAHLDQQKEDTKTKLNNMFP